ncbi:MAG: hypothetical protein ACHQCG_03870 [Solirubrobacterales bacterium]
MNSSWAVRSWSRASSHAGAGEPLDRLAIEQLGGFPFREQHPRAGLDAERPVGVSGCGRLRKPAEGVGRELGLPNTRCARGSTRPVPAVGGERALLAADVVPLSA